MPIDKNLSAFNKKRDALKKAKALEAKRKAEAARKAQQAKAKANAEKRRTQAANLVKKGATWVTTEAGTTLLSSAWNQLFNADKASKTRTFKKGFVWTWFSQASDNIKESATDIAESEFNVHRTARKDKWKRFTNEQIANKKANLLAQQTATELEEEAREQANIDREKKFWVWWTEDLRLQNKTKTQLALQNIQTQKSEEAALKARKAAAIASWLSEPRWTVQTWAWALVGSALWRLDSAASILNNQLETSRLSLQGAQDRLDAAKRTWDAEKILKASQSIRELRTQEQNQKLQLITAQRQQLADTSSLLSWVETDDEILALAEKQWVDATMLTMARDKVAAANTTAENLAEVTANKTSWDNFWNISNDQLWVLSADQAAQWDEALWLSLWTVASWTLRAAAKTELEDAVLRQEISDAKIDRAKKIADTKKTEAETANLNKKRGSRTSSTSVNLADFIIGEEWFRENAYDDLTGQPIQPGDPVSWTPTIWYWFTTVNGVKVKAWDTMTKEEADREFERQLSERQTYLWLVTTPLSESQKAALASFEWNLWSNIWEWSWIIEAVNEKDFEKAWNLMKQYNWAADKSIANEQECRIQWWSWGWWRCIMAMAWLTNRRWREAEMLLKTEAKSSWAWVWSQHYDKAIDSWMSDEAAEKFADKRYEDTFSKLTGEQWKAFNAYSTMESENELYDELVADVSTTEKFADAMSYFRLKIKNIDDPITAQLINQATSDEGIRRAILSEVRWVEAALREESGAAISVWEYLSKGVANFPRKWDDELTVEDKRRARETATNNKWIKMWPSAQRQYNESQAETLPKWRYRNATKWRWGMEQE